jgi:hypothetical protein
VFYVTDCHSRPTFEYRRTPDGMIHLHARPSDGLLRATAVIRWDLDDDGIPDPNVTGLDIVKRIDEVGGQVTMWVDDPIDGKTESVTRTIEFGESSSSSSDPGGASSTPPTPTSAKPVGGER